MIRAHLRASIRDGALVFAEPARLAAWLALAKAQPVLVTLEREPRTRTLKQNRRWFSAIIPFASEVLEQQYNRKFSKDATHDLLCKAFLGFEEVQIGGKVIQERRSSRKLTTEDFAKLSDEADRWISESFRVDPALIQAEEELP